MWREWVFQITVFGVLATLVLNMLPKEVYKKYVKLSLGFLLILIMLKPLMQVLDFEDGVNQIFSDLYIEMEEMERTDDFREAEETYQRLLQELYEESVLELGESPYITEEE